MEASVSIVLLKPGVYVLRHPKAGLPALSVGRAPGGPESVGRAEVLSTPGTFGTILRSPADCIVMLITGAPVELLVTCVLEQPGQAVPALRVDRIDLESDAPAPLAAPPVFEIPPKGISIIGHVERTGDVMAPPGQQLGNVEKDFRLEGFQVMWADKPDGVDLAYSVTIEGHGATPFVTSGTFCGTRGEGRRITAVSFALTGAAAAAYRLKGQVAFSGGFAVPVEGSELLSGPSGLEQLVAVSLSVEPAAVAAPKAKNPWTDEKSTKVIKRKLPPKAR